MTLSQGNQPVTGEFPSQRASNASFDFCYVSLNKRLNKQLSAGDLRRHGGHCDVTVMNSDFRFDPCCCRSIGGRGDIIIKWIVHLKIQRIIKIDHVEIYDH